MDSLNFRVSDMAKAKYDESLHKLAVAGMMQWASWIRDSAGSAASKVRLEAVRLSGCANAGPFNVMMTASAKSARDAAVIAPQLEAGTSDLNLTVSAEVLIKR